MAHRVMFGKAVALVAAVALTLAATACGGSSPNAMSTAPRPTRILSTSSMATAVTGRLHDFYVQWTYYRLCISSGDESQCGWRQQQMRSQARDVTALFSDPSSLRDDQLASADLVQLAEATSMDGAKVAHDLDPYSFSNELDPDGHLTGVAISNCEQLFRDYELWIAYLPAL